MTLSTLGTWISLAKLAPLLLFNCLWLMAHLIVTNIIARKCNCSLFTGTSSWYTKAFWWLANFNYGLVCIYYGISNIRGKWNEWYDSILLTGSSYWIKCQQYKFHAFSLHIPTICQKIFIYHYLVLFLWGIRQWAYHVSKNDLGGQELLPTL